MLLLLHAWLDSPWADAKRAGQEYDYLSQTYNRTATRDGWNPGPLERFERRNMRSLYGTAISHAIAGAMIAVPLLGPAGMLAGFCIGLITGLVTAAAVNKSVETLSINNTKTEDDYPRKYNPGVALEGTRDVRRAILWASFLALLGVGLALSGLFTIPGLALLGTTGAVLAQGGIGLLIGLWDGSAAHLVRHKKLALHPYRTFTTILGITLLTTAITLISLGIAPAVLGLSGLGLYGAYCGLAIGITGLTGIHLHYKAKYSNSAPTSFDDTKAIESLPPAQPQAYTIHSQEKNQQTLFGHPARLYQAVDKHPEKGSFLQARGHIDGSTLNTFKFG